MDVARDGARHADLVVVAAQGLDGAKVGLQDLVVFALVLIAGLPYRTEQVNPAPKSIVPSAARR